MFGIEDDVGRIEAGLLGQQLVGALADLDLALDRVGLAGLVERHDDDAGAVALDQLAPCARKSASPSFRLIELTTPLPCTHFRPASMHRPLRAVDHDRHARDLRLGRDVVQERRHRLLGVEHAFVHVDVDHVGAAAHLVERHVRGLGVVAALDQPREPRRAGDVGALADHLEVAVGPDGQRLEAGELRVVIGCAAGAGDAARGMQPRARRQRPRRRPSTALRDRRDVIRRRAAAAADDVDEAAGGEVAQQRAGLVGLLVVLAERVRQAGVRVAADVALGDPRELGEVRPHVARAERAVDADAERPGVAIET